MQNMNDERTPWSCFYTTLNRLAPKLLQNVHPEFIAYIEYEAVESDQFWSGGLHSAFDLWEEGKHLEAAEFALNVWCHNVQNHLNGLLGPDSCFPFDTYGITPKKRKTLLRSVENIKILFDKEHTNWLIDAILIEIAQTLNTPELLVQGIIEPYSECSEGKLIHSIHLPWNVITDTLINNWNMAFKIPCYKWEEMIAAAFDKAGFDEVILTPRSGDHGRDVIAIKKGIGSIRIIGSVKAYKPGHLVKHDDLRALLGVLHGDQQASKAIITTTSDFAPGIIHDPFIKPFLPYRLELMNGEKLKEWFLKLSQSTK
jgi:restriction system protein